MWAISRAIFLNISKTANLFLKKLPEMPQSGIILGSGLGGITSLLKSPIKISFRDIPDHPYPSITGHKGEWVFGYINSKPIICTSGRVHYYESFSRDFMTREKLITKTPHLIYNKAFPFFETTPTNTISLVNLTSIKDFENKIDRKIEHERFRANIYIESADPGLFF